MSDSNTHQVGPDPAIPTPLAGSAYFLRQEADAMQSVYEMFDEHDPDELARIAKFRGAANEIDRLHMVAQTAHDRLLRGDSDKEILEILAGAWRDRTDMPNNSDEGHSK